LSPTPRPFAAVALGTALLGLVTSGCAVTLGAVRAATGEWPSSRTEVGRIWHGGPPKRVVTVEARLETPPRAICSTVTHVPDATVSLLESGVDTPGRVAIGFVGVSELVAGVMPLALATRSARGEDAPGIEAAAAVALGALALDGVISIILAATIPSYQRALTEEAAAYTTTSDTCPPGLAFEVGAELLPVGADGHLLEADALRLMSVAVDTGLPVGLSHAGRVDYTPVPPPILCAWAVTVRGSPSAGAAPSAWPWCGPEVVDP
jgi:hypothetical protein